MGKNQEESAPNRVRAGFLNPEKAQLLWLSLGGAITLLALVVKIHALIVSPAVFEFVFFNGPSYAFFIGGLVLIAAALVHDELFLEDPEAEDEARG